MVIIFFFNTFIMFYRRLHAFFFIPKRMSRHLCVTFQNLMFSLLLSHNFWGSLCPLTDQHLVFLQGPLLSTSLAAQATLDGCVVHWVMFQEAGRLFSLSHFLCNYVIELGECQLPVEDSEVFFALWPQSLGHKRLNHPSQFSHSSQQSVIGT